MYALSLTQHKLLLVTGAKRAGCKHMGDEALKLRPRYACCHGCRFVPRSHTLSHILLTVLMGSLNKALKSRHLILAAAAPPAWGLPSDSPFLMEALQDSDALHRHACNKLRV